MVNAKALLIPTTLNTPLNPEFPAPNVLLALLTPLIWTNDPTDKSCGSSATMLAVLSDNHFASAINLEFLNWFT